MQAYLSRDEQGHYRIPAIHQRPILLMGPPGIGKTQIMEQIAKECQIGLVSYTITHHTRQSAVGLPFIRQVEYQGQEYSVTEYTMSEIIASIYRQMETDGQREGILFIDEINCVSETLTPTMLQFLQCKTFGNQAVPEGWIIVAAGNPPEYNRSVHEFDMVTLDRVRYLEIEADYSVWKEYARGKRIHGALMGYLELHPRNFYRVEPGAEGLQFVTARGWEDLSNLLLTYEELDICAEEDLFYEYLRHRDVAEDVAAYVDLYQKYKEDYGIPDILQGKVKQSVYERLARAEFDERISVVNLLLDGLLCYFHDTAKERKKTDEEYAALKEGADRLRAEGEEVLEKAKKSFLEQKELLEQREKQTEAALEHTFDLMEQAFENGQEIVFFVTELAVSPDASAFLAEHTCERYLKYNQELLIGSRKRELLNELER